MREPYRDEHDRSMSRRNYRIDRPRGLRKLLKWAHHAYQLETPSLEHAIAEFDPGGAPEMKPAARAWVGLNADEMDWRRIACRTDKDGNYVTPIRCAIESMEPYRRTVLRAVVPQLFDVASSVRTALGPIPEQAALDTAERSLEMLWERAGDRPIPRPRKVGWVDMSESERNAIIEGEKGVA